jgi:hypothetical protein
LYAAVEGRGPFDDRGNSIAILAAIANEEAPRPRSAGPLRQVIEALLHRNPLARPDAAAISRLLTAAGAGAARSAAARSGATETRPGPPGPRPVPPGLAPEPLGTPGMPGWALRPLLLIIPGLAMPGPPPQAARAHPRPGPQVRPSGRTTARGLKVGRSPARRGPPRFRPPTSRPLDRRPPRPTPRDQWPGVMAPRRRGCGAGWPPTSRRCSRVGAAGCWSSSPRSPSWGRASWPGWP